MSLVSDHCRDIRYGISFIRSLVNYISTVSKNFGGLRECVACSKAYAYLRSAGSLHAAPKNDIPTGNPKTNPAGTVMLGYPATAAMVELPPRK
jgi:hypothetical protein